MRMFSLAGSTNISPLIYRHEKSSKNGDILLIEIQEAGGAQRRKKELEKWRSYSMAGGARDAGAGMATGTGTSSRKAMTLSAGFHTSSQTSAFCLLLLCRWRHLPIYLSITRTNLVPLFLRYLHSVGT